MLLRGLGAADSTGGPGHGSSRRERGEGRCLGSRESLGRVQVGHFPDAHRVVIAL